MTDKEKIQKLADIATQLIHDAECQYGCDVIFPTNYFEDLRKEIEELKGE